MVRLRAKKLKGINYLSQGKTKMEVINGGIKMATLSALKVLKALSLASLTVFSGCRRSPEGKTEVQGDTATV
jgi:hypothetical protein